jgi:predicted transposase YbfD/YdcC
MKAKKKYNKGGKVSAVAAIQAGQASVKDKKEDLMQGRTFIPKMSAETRENLIEEGREIVGKLRAKKKKSSKNVKSKNRKEVDSPIYKKKKEPVNNILRHLLPSSKRNNA